MKAGRRRRAATNSPESSESNWVTKIVETKWVFLSLFADIAANVYNKKSLVGNLYTRTDAGAPWMGERERESACMSVCVCVWERV